MSPYSQRSVPMISAHSTAHRLAAAEKPCRWRSVRPEPAMATLPAPFAMDLDPEAITRLDGDGQVCDVALLQTSVRPVKSTVLPSSMVRVAAVNSVGTRPER